MTKDVADIVERLRLFSDVYGNVCNEAADEIERLRHDLERSKSAEEMKLYQAGYDHGFRDGESSAHEPTEQPTLT
jgi:hypothetical protein